MSSSRTSSGATSEFKAPCEAVCSFSCFLAYRRGSDLAPRAGFQYARGRIQAAIWRRDRGRPAATFPAVYPSFQFAGAHNPSPERQARSPQSPGSQGGSGSYFQQANNFGPAVPGATAPGWGGPQSPQPYTAHPLRNEPAALPQAGAMASYAPGFSPDGSGRMVDYPPPPYPPANWKPPDPVPGSPPVSAGAAAAVEVAVRYLEAVNKAVGVCIELDAM